MQAVGGAGYLLFFAIGFAEFVGLPLAGGASLVVAGALASHGRVDPVLAVLGAAAGALLGDALWYGAARGVGPRLVGLAARLFRNPHGFEAGVRGRIARFGPGYLVPAKFVPGVGAIAACAAAFGGVGVRRFLAIDGAATLLWAGAYVTAGWVFGRQVDRVVDGLGALGPGLLAAAGVGALVVLALRFTRGGAGGPAVPTSTHGR